MNVPNVKLYFTTGGTGSEGVLAPGYHVYVDLDPKAPGVMKHLRSDASGTIVPDPSSPSDASPSPGPKVVGGAITLDDSRTYNVVVSSAALSTVPSVGVSAKVAGGKLSIPAHIAVQLTSDGSKPVSGASCELTIGSTAVSAKSSTTGWVLSADRTAGAVTLAVKDKTVVAAGGSAPKATLAATPTKPVRGDKAKIAISGPTGAVGFKVTEWKYEISHQNPGTSTPATTSVVRPATESKATFGDFWEDVLCASGTVKARFAAGITLRISGDKAVSATVTVQDAAETSLAVTVEPRTGTAWESGLVEKPEQSLVRAIATFHDTGEHKWDPSALKVDPAGAIAEGPNRGCTFVKSASITFTSSPFINSLLTNAASTFSVAQDKAYLTTPAPVRVIPSHLYTAGPSGKITIKDNDAFAAWMLGRPLKPGESWSGKMSGHCIDQSRLLAGTQRHEYKDPDKSHKQNCLKARRALDPIKFAEALVQLPGKTINFLNLVNSRATAIINAAPTHDVVDETETRKAGALKFKAGEQILGVNLDSTGTVIGPAWNPTANAELK